MLLKPHKTVKLDLKTNIWKKTSLNRRSDDNAPKQHCGHTKHNSKRGKRPDGVNRIVTLNREENEASSAADKETHFSLLPRRCQQLVLRAIKENPPIEGLGN
ncbi:hypothetical protein TNCT_32121 [Trichonephila clavata]|uniref:Uncharacterized protein n=1 Tax=Trichonephila clavata TaxID=2740835 RepID=A0A8X6J1P8_TRICU|nr:hypothetical protein TNCT_32121 [Trichonephila clavata]